MRLLLRIGLGTAIVVVVAFVAVVLTWGRTTSAAPATHAAESSAVTPVTTVHPERQTLRQTVEQPGQIEGFEEAPLYVRIAGYVQKLHADIGDRVKAGQVLADLSVPELQEELHQKEAAVSLAQAEIDLVQRALKAAEASLHKAEAAVQHAQAGRIRAEASYNRWKAEYDRVRRLVSRQVLDQATHDQTLDQFTSAEAARDESQANIQLARAAREESAAQRDQAASKVQVAVAQLRVAEADRRHTAAMVAYAQVRAPFDGVVTRRPVNTGHFVQPSQGSSTGTPLFVVVRTDPVRIFVDVPELAASQVGPGTPAKLHVPALQEQEVEGKVTRCSWVLDQHTRTLRTQIDLPNENGRLRPGMYATAIITVERPGALTLPSAAVLLQDDQPAIVRIVDGRAVRTPVKLGVHQGQRVEVLQKQAPARHDEPIVWERITGREEVVLSSPAALTDGQAVRSQPADPDGSQTAHAGQGKQSVR